MRSPLFFACLSFLLCACGPERELSISTETSHDVLRLRALVHATTCDWSPGTTVCAGGSGPGTLRAYRCEPAAACAELERDDERALVEMKMPRFQVTIDAEGAGDRDEERFEIEAPPPEYAYRGHHLAVVGSSVEGCVQSAPMHQPDWLVHERSWSKPFGLLATRGDEPIAGESYTRGEWRCARFVASSTEALDLVPTWFGAPISSEPAVPSGAPNPPPPRAERIHVVEPSSIERIEVRDMSWLRDTRHAECGDGGCLVTTVRGTTTGGSAVALPGRWVRIESHEALERLSDDSDPEIVYRRSGRGPFAGTVHVESPAHRCRAIWQNETLESPVAWSPCE